jgi:hypothetical protein
MMSFNPYADSAVKQIKFVGADSSFSNLIFHGGEFLERFRTHALDVGSAQFQQVCVNEAAMRG